MEYKVEKKSAPGREKVEVLGATFEEGKPEGEGLGKWRQEMETETGEQTGKAQISANR